MSRTEWKLHSLSYRINYFGRQLWRSSKLWATFFCSFFFGSYLQILTDLYDHRLVWEIRLFCSIQLFLTKKKIIEGQKDIFTGIVLMSFHGTDSLSRSLHTFKLLKFFKWKVHHDAIESLSKNEKLLCLHRVKRNQNNV